MVENLYINRRLSWRDDEGNRHEELEQDILDNFPQPLTVLGAPGLGKTRLMERLGKREDCCFVRATSFLRWPDAPLEDNRRLVIDGLDEVAAAQEGDPLHNVLKKLSACGKPRFILSCRSVEWRNVTAETDIADDYGSDPKILYLEPLSEQEAVTALSQEVDEANAEKVIGKLKEEGLTALYKNPLTLNFIKAIVRGDGAIPDSRAELYEKAVSQLRLERNERHKKSMLANLSDDQALDAAGAATATLLITGHQAITQSPQDTSALQLSEIGDFEDADGIRAVLGSNLFRIDTGGDAKSLPLHRTIAEFLAARWLAQKIKGHPYPQRTSSRLIGLISAEGGLPASLRGMIAWFPKFSPEHLGPKIIDMDPFAVLRYGDGDGLSVRQASEMLRSLVSLSKFDPFFRSDYWDKFSAKGLVREELQDELQTLILNPDASPHLRSIILECLEGSSTAALLQNDLKMIALSTSHNYRERFVSAEVLINLDEKSQDWTMIAEQLVTLGDESSARLAVETMMIVGPKKFAPQLIADAIIANFRILEKSQKDDRSRMVGSYYRLQRGISDDQIIPVLNALTARVLPTRDLEKWWDPGYDEGWSEFCKLINHLIYRQLEYNLRAVRPEQLWDWMRASERYRNSHRDERRAIAHIFAAKDQLRQSIQKLALFEPGTEENFFLREDNLVRLSSGLSLQDKDVKYHLRELVSRKYLAERDHWIALVGRLRCEDGFIPKDVQTIARPYIDGDEKLLEFLTKKPKKCPLSDREKKVRRNTRERKKRKEKNIEKLRENFSKNIAAMKSGELRWIINPAKAYLGMYRDLEEADPESRVCEWLGEDLRDAALAGFEAVLGRDDLPTSKQVVESFTNSEVWNFIYPMLAGTGNRMHQNRRLSDLSEDLLFALAIGAEQLHIEQRQGFEGLREWLVQELKKRPGQFEKYLRQRFEPFFETKSKHVTGLYEFTRSDKERPFASQLCAEWLTRYDELPLEIERELAGCILHTGSEKRADIWLRLKGIANCKLEAITTDEDRRMFWLSILYMLDFEHAIAELPNINPENRDLLWFLTHNFYQRHGDEAPASASIKQLRWIISTFRSEWPHTDRPNGITSGDDNPWDATQLLEWAIFRIAADPSDQATSALHQLRDMPPDGYTTAIRAAIAQQHRVRLEDRFRNPQIADLKAVLEDGPPNSAADVQAIVLEELDRLQKRLSGDRLNIVNNFYEGAKPKTENECRDQMLISLGELPFGIQAAPEPVMPQGKRGDVAFTFMDIGVPLEAKGQWHKEVWTAAGTQLDRLYASDYRAAAKGIYVVFWFGSNVSAGKKLRKPPSGITSPASAKQMQTSLGASIPQHRQGDIKVIVLDLTRS